MKRTGQLLWAYFVWLSFFFLFLLEFFFSFFLFNLIILIVKTRSCCLETHVFSNRYVWFEIHGPWRMGKVCNALVWGNWCCKYLPPYSPPLFITLSFFSFFLFLVWILFGESRSRCSRSFIWWKDHKKTLMLCSKSIATLIWQVYGRKECHSFRTPVLKYF